jgi:hypothetical protein
MVDMTVELLDVIMVVELVSLKAGLKEVEKVDDLAV